MTQLKDEIESENEVWTRNLLTNPHLTCKFKKKTKVVWLKDLEFEPLQMRDLLGVVIHVGWLCSYLCQSKGIVIHGSTLTQPI